MGNDSGGMGTAGRRKKRGWRKGWWKRYWKVAPPGSFRFIPGFSGKDDK